MMLAGLPAAGAGAPGAAGHVTPPTPPARPAPPDAARPPAGGGPHGARRTPEEGPGAGPGWRAAPLGGGARRPGRGDPPRGAVGGRARAEALSGPSRVLEEERTLPGAPLPAAPQGGEGTAWEHYALGRALLRSGQVDRA